MRHLGTAIGTGVLLVLVAGCAQQTGSAAGGGSLNTSTAASPTGPNPPPVPAPPPAPVRKVPGAPAGAPRLPQGAEPVAGAKVDARSLPGSFPHSVWSEKGGTVLGFFGE